MLRMSVTSFVLIVEVDIVDLVVSLDTAVASIFVGEWTVFVKWLVLIFVVTAPVLSTEVDAGDSVFPVGVIVVTDVDCISLVIIVVDVLW